MGHSFKGSAWNRKGGAWIIALLLAVMLVLSACSSASDDASNRGESTSDNMEAGNAAPAEESTSNSVEKDLDTSEPMPPETETEKVGKRGYGNSDKEPQAGQLTAGEWDDLTAWERFGNVLNSQEGDSSRRVWSFWNFHRLQVIVTASGNAVADAKVQLLDGKQTIWEARTNTEGRAYVFAGLFDEKDRNSNAYTVKVQAAQESKTTTNIEIPEQGTLKVDLDKGTQLPGQVDIMFVVDTTGSMEDELNYLEAELKDVVERVADEHANQLGIRISSNFYRDKNDDYIVKPYPFTTDVDKVIDQFSEQKASGGGDYPEAVDHALRDAIWEHKWSQEARARLLFLVLDAPPHDDEQIIDEIQQLTAEAADQGIRIIPVASSGVDINTEHLLRFMAVATGGTYIFLTDDSGIGSDHLEPEVGEYEVKPLNDLLVEIINRYVQE